MKIEEEVLARLKPSPADEARIQEIIALLLKKVMGTKAAKGADIEPYLVGSIAKDTHLRDPDADLFLLFDPKVPREELERVGLAIGREAVTGREHYAEHPYIKGEFMGLKVDIVPAYRIVDSSQKMTAVDRTPFHTEFVRKNLVPELRDDVRLLKAFMKGVGTYGADAKTMGFSGYLCELLVIRYGGFLRLLEDASAWKQGMRSEIGPKTDRKFDAPLTFIDPVDPARNVASALSPDCFATFIAASRAYIASPILEFFFPNPVKLLSARDIGEMTASRGSIIIIAAPRPDLIDDILYPQLRKFERNAAQHLESYGFGVMDSSSYVLKDSLTIVIEMRNSELPGAALHRGPPVSASENSANFLAKWDRSPESLSRPFIKDGCWHLFVRRKHTLATELLREGLEGIDAGKDLNSLKPKMTLGNAADDEFGVALSAYLDRRMPWERS